MARRFARDGYAAVVVLRTNAESLDEVCGWIRDDGGTAHGYLIDATVEEELQALVATVEQDIGPIHIAVYNLGANMGSRTLEMTTTKVFDNATKLGSRGAFVLSQTVVPYMLSRPADTMQSLFFTGATSGVRGNATQLAHATGMFGRRAIAQSLCHELWPLGIHVASINVDGLVDAPDTIGRVSGERWESMRAAAEERGSILKPEAVADAWHYLHSQPRNCW